MSKNKKYNPICIVLLFTILCSQAVTIGLAFDPPSPYFEYNPYSISVSPGNAFNYTILTNGTIGSYMNYSSGVKTPMAEIYTSGVLQENYKINAQNHQNVNFTRNVSGDFIQKITDYSNNNEQSSNNSKSNEQNVSLPLDNRYKTYLEDPFLFPQNISLDLLTNHSYIFKYLEYTQLSVGILSEQEIPPINEVFTGNLKIHSLIDADTIQIDRSAANGSSELWKFNNFYIPENSVHSSLCYEINNIRTISDEILEFDLVILPNHADMLSYNLSIGEFAYIYSGFTIKDNFKVIGFGIETNILLAQNIETPYAQNNYLRIFGSKLGFANLSEDLRIINVTRINTVDYITLEKNVTLSNLKSDAWVIENFDGPLVGIANVSIFDFLYDEFSECNGFRIQKPSNINNWANWINRRIEITHDSQTIIFQIRSVSETLINEVPYWDIIFYPEGDFDNFDYYFSTNDVVQISHRDPELKDTQENEGELNFEDGLVNGFMTALTGIKFDDNNYAVFESNNSARIYNASKNAYFEMEIYFPDVGQGEGTIISNSTILMELTPANVLAKLIINTRMILVGEFPSRPGQIYLIELNFNFEKLLKGYIPSDSATEAPPTIEEYNLFTDPIFIGSVTAGLISIFAAGIGIGILKEKKSKSKAKTEDTENPNQPTQSNIFITKSDKKILLQPLSPAITILMLIIGYLIGFSLLYFGLARTNIGTYLSISFISIIIGIVALISKNKILQALYWPLVPSYIGLMIWMYIINAPIGMIIIHIPHLIVAILFLLYQREIGPINVMISGGIWIGYLICMYLIRPDLFVIFPYEHLSPMIIGFVVSIILATVYLYIYNNFRVRRREISSIPNVSEIDEIPKIFAIIIPEDSKRTKILTLSLILSYICGSLILYFGFQITDLEGYLSISFICLCIGIISLIYDSETLRAMIWAVIPYFVFQFIYNLFSGAAVLDVILYLPHFLLALYYLIRNRKISWSQIAIAGVIWNCYISTLKLLNISDISNNLTPYAIPELSLVWISLSTLVAMIFLSLTNSGKQITSYFTVSTITGAKSKIMPSSIILILSLIGIILPAIIWQLFFDISNTPDSYWIDLWSITHLCFFIFAYGILNRHIIPKKLIPLLISVGIIWEFIEYGLSYVLPLVRAISWEMFQNVISDIIFNCLGIIIGYFVFKNQGREFNGKMDSIISKIGAISTSNPQFPKYKSLFQKIMIAIGILGVCIFFIKYSIPNYNIQFGIPSSLTIWLSSLFIGSMVIGIFLLYILNKGGAKA